MWSRSSPIPTDPVYLDAHSTQSVSSARHNQLKKTSSSPIPIDPVYGDRATEFAPKPRIKSEALHIARLHQGGALAQLFNPGFKVIPIGGRPASHSAKDYGQENYSKIKQMQRANKERQKESARGQPVKAVYKAGKFDHVSSKVTQQIQLQKTPTAPRPQSADYLKAHSKAGPPVKLTSRPASARAASARPASAEPVIPREVKLTVPKTTSRTEVTNERKPLNHIAQNVKTVKKTSIKRAPSLSALDDLKKKREKEFTDYKRGYVPKYLRSRQEQWKKEEETKQASIPDPTIPAGHSEMPDEERRKTLDMLKKSQEDMLRELQALPVSRDTLRVKQRRELLERKLQEVETAIKIFSRPRVFVKNE